jgi:hypothetical protein
MDRTLIRTRWRLLPGAGSVLSLEKRLTYADPRRPGGESGR